MGGPVTGALWTIDRGGPGGGAIQFLGSRRAESSAGILGHRSDGYRTTEVYAKYAPDYLGLAVKAIDAYFTDLSTLTKRPLRTRCVPVEKIKGSE